MRQPSVIHVVGTALVLGFGVCAYAQPSTPPRGPAPTHANIAYAPAEPADSKGHLLDLYLPPKASAPAPLVIWTSGSAWMADSGKSRAEVFAAELNRHGFAVAGVSIRSSAQVKFPGQLHDIKAAIRWLRRNAAKYDLDANRIAIMGDSSGGWTTAMAALTGDVPQLEGTVGVTGVSSAVQAAVAFYPPTDFLAMDRWAIRPCAADSAPGPGSAFCHDAANSPESLLVGCAIQSCPERVELANPARYVSDADPPIMILHGQSDPLVPHNQGELLYQALNKACHEAVFISLPPAGHGPAPGFLSDDAIRAGATRRSTSVRGCAIENPHPYTPTWDTVVDFLRSSLK
jgi:acetyl esterase/lipase